MLKMNIIRHGKTYGNSKGRYIGTTDEPLLPEEAEALRQYTLEEMEQVFASPLMRCVQTAKILFPRKDPCLISEFSECDFGKFENKNYQELRNNPDYQKWLDSGGGLIFPGGESMVEFQERCLAGLEVVVAMAYEKDWKKIALIVHEGTIMTILGTYGFPPKDYFEWHVNNGEGYQVRFSAEAFYRGSRELVVDNKIVRSKK
ncbi:MAG: histidine phosphatase family protein [Lachnospiraceae bacterium]|nr:histidine phosphatase family protein [Lachnospiraceae bacterium]